ncbi:MAG: NADH:flavin oxidoreductase [Smithellaceae bacterium]|nr:NADH:flavin oxidoreductase [Smithellaceae bacterium]NLX52253.1 NADH:flavin oxidoreductase [Deltaproteobacteria bacterium]
MKVFQPAHLGAMALANCFVRSATAEGLASGTGRCSPQLIGLLAELARGGVGLIITGRTAVSPEGREDARQLCLWHEDHLPALLELTQRIRDEGGKMLMQLGHAGFFADAATNGAAAFGPTAGRRQNGSFCREMTRVDIRKTTDAFARAALLAREAGFDGVQIDAARGRLMSAFLAKHANRRRDEYGGTAENRARFLLEVLDAVRRAVGRDYPAAVKIDAGDFPPEGPGTEDLSGIAARLEAFGATAVELTGGTDPSIARIPACPDDTRPESEGCFRREAQAIKKAIALPLILNGGCRALESAERFLEEKICDFVALSRPLICEPDLIHRWQKKDRAPSRCRSDNQCCRTVRAGKGLYCLTRRRENQSE